MTKNRKPKGNTKRRLGVISYAEEFPEALHDCIDLTIGAEQDVEDWKKVRGVEALKKACISLGAAKGICRIAQMAALEKRDNSEFVTASENRHRMTKTYNSLSCSEMVLK